MNPKDRAKTMLFRLLRELKPIALAIVLLATLNATGLIGSVSYFGHWALLQSGFNDANAEVPADSGTEEHVEDFDFHFMIKDLQGNRLQFEKFKGKVVFLNLWATWCGPCRAEMPGIQRLYERSDTSKVAFVMLSIDKDSDLKKVVAYLEKGKYTFGTYMPSGYLPDQLKVPLIPTTFVLSKSGKVEYKQVGSKRYDTTKFEKFLAKLTSEP